jgi:NhaA family Na+:H+ antiporter
MSEHADPVMEIRKQPIDRLTGPLKKFLHVEAASGVMLLICTIVALVLANSRWSEGFLALWQTKLTFALGSFEMSHSLKHWINDGLMAVFFFVIGLEVKREMVLGELRDIRRALLPIFAAIGGMIAPAGVYLALQAGQPGQRGWGIPMATDIAFVVGCMAVLGPRVPHGLRILLLSLAIADDIGAILVIAIGYTEHLHWGALLAGIAGLGTVLVMLRLGVRSLGLYAVLAVLIWLAFHESGVHATIAGVILGIMTPAEAYLSTSIFGRVLDRAREVLHGEWDSVPHRAEKVRQFQWAARETLSPLEYLEGTLHPWVGFLIMPVFALANAGVPIHVSDFADPVALAVGAGLLIGKPLGIVVLSWLVINIGLAQLPPGVSWGALTGGGFLAGIGFTMALFIAGLALDGEPLDAAKVGILGASALAAAIGMITLLSRLPKPVAPDLAHQPSAAAAENAPSSE